MANNFAPHPELCAQYAQFASHLERWQFKTIYWTLFISNIAVLFFASWIYTRGQTILENKSTQSTRRARALQKYIFLCLACVIVSAVIIVMEVYSLMALQFCEGEDLMALYWSTWTMIQVGSLIAMVGIILALLHSLWNSKHPPWALALGTPVLVIAGFLHLFHECTKKKVKELRRRASASEVSSTDEGPPMSRQNTIRVSPEEELGQDTHVELVGLALQGGPIVRFVEPLPGLITKQGEIITTQGEIFGYFDTKRPVMPYRKGSVTFASDEGSTMQN